MIIKLYNNNPEQQLIDQITRQLNNGDIIVYPTGHGYALGCSALKQRAVERVCQMKQINPKKVNLAILCLNLSDASNYAKINKQVFQTIKAGEYEPATYILPANNKLPKIFNNKREVGIQLCDNSITRALIETLGTPLLTGSLPEELYTNQEAHNPELIELQLGHAVSTIIDGGILKPYYTTLIDCTTTDINILRHSESH